MTIRTEGLNLEDLDGARLTLLIQALDLWAVNLAGYFEFTQPGPGWENDLVFALRPDLKDRHWVQAYVEGSVPHGARDIPLWFRRTRWNEDKKTHEDWWVQVKPTTEGFVVLVKQRAEPEGLRISRSKTMDSWAWVPKACYEYQFIDINPQPGDPIFDKPERALQGTRRSESEGLATWGDSRHRMAYSHAVCRALQRDTGFIVAWMIERQTISRPAEGWLPVLLQQVYGVDHKDLADCGSLSAGLSSIGDALRGEKKNYAW